MALRLLSGKGLKDTEHKNFLKLLVLLFCTILPVSCTDKNNTNEKSVTFEVVLPSSARDSVVYITGNKEELGNWSADKIALQKTPEGIWKRTFSFKRGSHVEYKFTRGSWETEAVNSDGSIPQNSILEVSEDTVVTTYIGRWLSQDYNGVIDLPYNALDNPIQMYMLNPFWKFHPGDDTSWANPKYNDKDWFVMSTLRTPWDDTSGIWNGIGWFRLHINIDTSLVNKPIYLFVRQFGASEIYLNGKLIRRLGRIGSPPNKEVGHIQREPIIITFSGMHDQILAIRYSNYLTLPFRKFGFSTGFNTILSDPEKIIKITETSDYQLIVTEMTFAGIPLILALLHLLFFMFYPNDKTNLFYGLCLLSFSLSFFLYYQIYFTTSPQQVFLFNKLTLIDNPFIVLLGMLSVSFAYRDSKKLRIIIFTLSAISLGIWALIWPTKSAIYVFYIYIVLAMLELFRIIFSSRAKNEGSPWLLATGFGILTFTIIYNIVLNLGLIKPIMGITIDTGYGMLALIISQSINLSLGFARTHKNLEKQLKQVQELSKKAIEQERLSRQQEMENKLLEADNERKTDELEEARRVQLSMLPKNIPLLPNIEITAFMKTATEVGGDYYDFKITKDNEFFAAIGDATGHGTKAGTMVTISKILFNELTKGSELVDILHRFTDAIKLMNLDKLYMGLTLLYIKDYLLKVSSAGMPPFFIYHSKENCIEEVIIKGMPLGSFSDFPYQLKEFELSKGDIILLMSDGYIEQFNEKKEMLGAETAKRILLENSNNTLDIIINRLMDSLTSWQKNSVQQDDITFVVMKIK